MFLHTKIITILAEQPDSALLAPAAELLKAGELVAFPTETVYGLGANALSAEAVKKIFVAKGRPTDNPLIVHIAKLEQLTELVTKVPVAAKMAMEAFWPGPLTLIMPKSSKVPEVVTAGLATVAIRMPDHPVALALLALTNIPIAAPSANLSGKPSPTKAEHVIKDLSGRVAAIIAGGDATVGVESTVLDCTVTPPMILRPGAITYEELVSVLGEVAIDKSLLDKSGLDVLYPRSPGMKYTHYAPLAKIYLLNSSDEEILAHLKVRVQEARAEGLRVGLLASDELAFQLERRGVEFQHIERLGSRTELSIIAGHLFHGLRQCDRFQIDLAYAECFPEGGLGFAIMNRLSRAAGKKKLFTAEELTLA